MRLGYAAVGLVGLLFIVSGATAVVDGPEPDDGELTIMDRGSSSATASSSVGAEGTEYRAETSMVNRSPNITDQRLENVNYSKEDYSVEFTGHIEASTPCHVIDHDVDETDEGFVLNVQTVTDDLDNQSAVCAEVLNMIEYEASFTSDEEFTVDVRHGKETIQTLQHPGVDDEQKKTGIIQSLRALLSRFF